MSKPITIAEVEKSIRNVPDFPKPGILFKDITTALKDPDIFHFLVDNLYEQYKNSGITKVVGIESRGFIMGAALAYKLNAGFVLVRKPGKLPAASYSQSYELEYGTNTLEIHTDALDTNDVVLLHDDLLATGGTVEAAAKLIKKCGTEKIFYSFICELGFLDGRKKVGENSSIYSILTF